MGFPSQSSFTKLQRKYLVPAVDDLWEEKQGEMTAEMADKDFLVHVFIYIFVVTMFVGQCTVKYM